MQHFFIYLSFWWWAAGAHVFMGVPFETLFSGSVDFQSNLTKALRRHKSVEIEISKTDMTLQLEFCRLQQGNLKGTTFYLQIHTCDLFKVHLAYFRQKKVFWEDPILWVSNFFQCTFWGYYFFEGGISFLNLTFCQELFFVGEIFDINEANYPDSVLNFAISDQSRLCKVTRQL